MILPFASVPKLVQLVYPAPVILKAFVPIPVVVPVIWDKPIASPSPFHIHISVVLPLVPVIKVWSEPERKVDFISVIASSPSALIVSTPIAR